MAWAPAAELAYQAGAKLEFNEARGELSAVTLPPGVFLAGRAAGAHALDNQLLDGRRAGAAAAAFVGKSRRQRMSAAAPMAAEPVRTSQRVSVPGHAHAKRIVCFCEDVTEKDITASVAEGFNSLELLKRYATVSMGPCQGKMCSVNSAHLCARANGWSMAETGGPTTLRPPTTP